MAVTKSVRARNLRFKNEEIGMIAESTSRYPVVTHCTVAVFTPNSSMSAGKATFIAVSTTTPVNDMMPTATMETTRHASRRRSSPDTLLPLFSHPGHDCGAKSRRSTIGPWLPSKPQGPLIDTPTATVRRSWPATPVAPPRTRRDTCSPTCGRA